MGKVVTKLRFMEKLFMSIKCPDCDSELVRGINSYGENYYICSDYKNCGFIRYFVEQSGHNAHFGENKTSSYSKKRGRPLFLKEFEAKDAFTDWLAEQGLNDDTIKTYITGAKQYIKFLEVVKNT